MFLIDWIPQSAVTLYIYRVGWTCPARNSITRFKSMKITSCTRTLLGPVRLVGPTDQTGRSCQTSYGITDRLVVNMHPDPNIVVMTRKVVVYGRTVCATSLVLVIPHVDGCTA